MFINYRDGYLILEPLDNKDRKILNDLVSKLYRDKCCYHTTSHQGDLIILRIYVTKNEQRKARALKTIIKYRSKAR